MTALVDKGDRRRASDLLPALAALHKEAAWEIIVSFRDAGHYADETIHPIIRALARIRSEQALEELDQIRTSGFHDSPRAVEASLRFDF